MVLGDQAPEAISHSGIQNNYEDEASAGFLKILVPKEERNVYLFSIQLITHRKHQKPLMTGPGRPLCLAGPRKIQVRTRLKAQ